MSYILKNKHLQLTTSPQTMIYRFMSFSSLRCGNRTLYIKSMYRASGLPNVIAHAVLYVTCQTPSQATAAGRSRPGPASSSIQMMHRYEWVGRNCVHKLTMEFLTHEAQPSGFRLVSIVNECTQLPTDPRKTCASSVL